MAKVPVAPKKKKLENVIESKFIHIIKSSDVVNRYGRVFEAHLERYSGFGVST